MSFSHVITQAWTDQGNTLTKTVTKTGGAEVNISESIADSTTDEEIACNLDYSAMESLYMVSDQDLQVETNDDAAATGQTINLEAGVPYLWLKDSGITCPITDDVTALFITNASGSPAQFDLRALLDATP